MEKILCQKAYENRLRETIVKIDSLNNIHKKLGI